MEEIGLSGVFELANFDQGMSHYMQGIEAANSKTEQTANSFSSAFGSMGSTVAGFAGKAGGLLLGFAGQAASAVAGFIPGAISAASDLNETVSKVGVVFGKSADDIMQWASTAATSMGQSQNQALAAVGTFGNLFVSMGLGTKPAADMSKGLVQLAGDLASFNNMDPTEVLEKLRAGVTGETEPLKTLGVNLSAAAVKAQAMKMGLATAKGELSASAKAQATYALILQQTKTAQGDFARTSDGLANGQRIIAAQFADITATIGNAFLPIMVKLTGAFAGFLSGAAPAITEWFKQFGYVIEAFSLGDVADINWENVAPAWLVPTLEAISGVLDKVFQVIQDFANGLGGFDYPWDKVFPGWLGTIASTISSAIQFVIANLDAFKGALGGVAALLASAGIMTALPAVGAAIAAINLPIVAIIGAAALLGAAWNANWFGIRDATIPIIQSVTNWLQQMWYVVQAFAEGDVADINWENVAPAWLVPALYDISAVLDGVFDVVNAAFAGSLSWDFPWEDVFPPNIADLAYSVTAAIQSVVQAFAPLVTAITTNGAGAMQELTNFVTGNQTSFENLKAVWNGAVQTAQNVFTGLVSTVSTNLPGWIAAFNGWAAPMVGWLADAATNAATYVASWFTALVSTLSANLPSWVAAFSEWAAPMVSWLADAALNVAGYIANWFTALVNSVSANLPSWIATFTAWAAPMTEWLANAAVNVGSYIASWFGALVGAVGANLPNWIATFSAWAAPMTEWLANAAVNVGGYIASWFSSLVGAVGANLPTWIATFTAWAAPMTDWLSNAVAGVGDKIAAWYGVLSAQVSANLPNWIAAFEGWASAATDWVTQAVSDAAPKVAEFASNLVSSIGEHLPDWIAGFLGFATAAVAWIGQALPKAITALGNFITGMVQWIGGSGKGQLTAQGPGLAESLIGWVDSQLIPKVGPALAKFGAALVQALGAITVAAAKAALEIAKAILQELDKIDLLALGKKLMGALVDGLVSIAGEIPGKLKAITEKITAAFSGVDWKSAGSNILTGMLGGVTAGTPSFTQSFTTLANTVKTSMTTAINWATDVGTYIITQIGNGNKAGQGTLVTTITGIARAMITAITTGINWLAEVGTYIITQIATGLQNGLSTLTSKATSLATSFKESWTTLDFSSVGKGIIDGISAGIDKYTSALLSKIKNLGSSAVDSISNAIGFNSPAKAFIPIGSGMVEGLEVGVMEREKNFLDMLHKIMDDALDIVVGFDYITGKNAEDVWNTWALDFNIASHSAKDLIGNVSSLLGLAEKTVKANPAAFNPFATSTKQFLNQVNAINSFNEQASRAEAILAMIRDNGLNPSAFLTGDINSMTDVQFAGIALQSAKILQAYQKDRLSAMQREIERAWDLRNASAAIVAQTQRMGTLVPADFFQKTEFDYAKVQIDSIDRGLAKMREEYMNTGNLSALGKINDLLDERSALIDKLSASEAGNAFFAPQLNRSAALQNLIDPLTKLVSQAKAFGIDTSDLFSTVLGGVDLLSDQALRKMSLLQTQVSLATGESMRQNFLALVALNGVDMNFNVQGVASKVAARYADTVLQPMLQTIRDMAQYENARVAAVNNYNNALGVTQQIQQKQGTLDFLQDQLDLLDKAKGAGLDLGSVFSTVFSGEASLGAHASINDLMVISNKLMDQLIKKAQTDLSPQALAVAKKQQQLDLLQQQIDIIQKGESAGVNTGGFFEGLQTGLNATQEDILIATQRLLDKLIKQSQKQLGIASPSKVFAEMGNQIVSGLGLGMQQAFNRPLFDIGSVPHGPVSNTSAAVNMGGVNIYTPMDEVLFEAKVQRILERTLQ